MSSEEASVKTTNSLENESQNENENEKKKNGSFSSWMKGMGKHLAKNWIIYTFFIIPIAYYIVFRYVPDSNTSNSSSETRHSEERLAIH